MRGTAQIRRTARLVGLLAVLLGLLAMHGLGSTHHAAAAAAAPVAGVAAVTDSGAAAPAGMVAGVAAPAVSHHAGLTSHGHRHTEAATPVAEPGTAAVDDLGIPACDERCQAGLAVLCVAVLTSAAVLAALARRRRTSHLLVSRRRTSLGRTPSAPWRPGLDPVAQLGISRT